MKGQKLALQNPQVQPLTVPNLFKRDPKFLLLKNIQPLIQTFISQDQDLMKGQQL